MNFKRLMSATTILHKGVIMYIGGEQTSRPGEGAVLTTSGPIWQLDIEKVVQAIQGIKNQKSLKKVLRVQPSDFWQQFNLTEEKDSSLVDLSGHTALLLPDLQSVLIVGGQYPKGGKNKRLMVLNINDRTLKAIDLYGSQDSFEPRLKPLVSLTSESDPSNSINVRVQGGISLADGQLLDDSYQLEIDLENLKYKSVNITKKYESQVVKESSYLAFVENVKS